MYKVILKWFWSIHDGKLMILLLQIGKSILLYYELGLKKII